MPRNRRWSREELVLALDLYFKIGASYKTHPDVIDLSECLNRLSDAGLEADSNRFRNPSRVLK
jgi:5-methylcytosine-specific restriction protein A